VTYHAFLDLGDMMKPSSELSPHDLRVTICQKQKEEKKKRKKNEVYNPPNLSSNLKFYCLLCSL
jgi:hypothetical protein